MVKFIKKVDLFGQHLNLYLKDKGKIKSNLGGVASIILILIILITSWFLGNDIIYKENPFTNEQRLVNSTFPNITLNKSTFPLSVAIVDWKMMFIDDPTYVSI